MSEPNERKEVFAWFGAAAYHAQCAEEELWIARLFLARRQGIGDADADWDRVESEPLTMGRLLRLVKEGIIVDETELASLRTSVEKRNWLFHKFWGQRSHLLVSSEGCREAVDELRSLSDLFERSDTIACGISARIRARLGISEHLVHELQAEYVWRLRSGGLSDVILDTMGARFRKSAVRPNSP